MCTITLEGHWDTYVGQLEMAALSRLRILYNELLAVQANQVVPWVVPWAAPTVWAACVGHGCGGPPVVRAYQVGESSPLELVGFLCW